ncbi:MAG: hypothetical protein IJO68_03175 [Clostridia bacterium]|nr:hypothetical protein [Clostridia bacterium]
MSEKNPFDSITDTAVNGKTEEIKSNASEDSNKGIVQNAAETENTPDKEAVPSSDSASTDSIPAGRFIKTNEAPFISASGSTEAEIPTTAKKYTDRLLPQVPARKPRTGYTGKINTYTANHSPAPDTAKFIPMGEKADEKKKAAVISEVSPEEDTVKIAQPEILRSSSPEEDAVSEPKVIVEKLPEKKDTDKTKHIASKGDLLREIAKSSGGEAEEEAEDENQLVMEGFGEKEESPTADDAELEKELSEVRAKRIKNFRFWTKSAVITGETEDESFSAPKEERKLPDFLDKIRSRFEHLDTDFVPASEDEYTDPSKRRELFSKLISIRKSVIIRAFAVALLGVILLLMNLITTVSASMNNGFFAVFGGSAVAYNAVNLVILLAVGILMANDLKKGFLSLLKIRPKTDSALLFIYLGALLQNIAAFFTVLKPENEYHMLSGAAVLMCVPVLIAKTFYLDSTRHCFKAVAGASDKGYLRKISDTSLIAELLKDGTNTETNVVYTGKTRFISGFMKRSAASAFGGQASSRAIALCTLLALISGIAGLILTKSPVYALGCLTGTLAFSFPVSCLVFSGFMLRNENSVLSVKSSYVQSFSDAHSFCCIDDIILNGADIFSAEVVSSVCNKNVNQKQAEFCAAVLTHNLNGILKAAFAGPVQGLQERFPEVEGLVFEEKLGISAWISDCRVLLGTKDFLISHNVELPKENTVPFVLQENEKPLFLAIEGHFAAVFVIKYSCNPGAAKSLCELTRHGANILISIQDPNITEEFGESLLGLPENSLRIIKSTVNKKFMESKDTVTDSEETGIVFSDSFEAFSRTMASAIKLDKVKRISKSLTEAVSVAGALFGLILTFAGARAGINSYLPVILQVFWILLGFVVTPALSATTLKEKIRLPESTHRRTEVSYNTEEEEEAENEEAVASSDSEGCLQEEENQPAPVNDTAEPETEKDEQMIMEGAPYTRPPEVIDFSAITGDEELNEESGEKTVSDDVLDAFAGDTPASRRAHRHSEDSEEAPKTASGGVRGLFGKLGIAPSQKREASPAKKSDEKERSAKNPFLSFNDETPPPPRYELGADKNKTEEDPLSVSFVPPENDSPSAVYTDDFFASYDTKEDDKAFEDIRRQRKQEDDDPNGLFGF